MLLLEIYAILPVFTCIFLCYPCHKVNRAFSVPLLLSCGNISPIAQVQLCLYLSNSWKHSYCARIVPLRPSSHTPNALKTIFLQRQEHKSHFTFKFWINRPVSQKGPVGHSRTFVLCLNVPELQNSGDFEWSHFSVWVSLSILCAHM